MNHGTGRSHVGEGPTYWLVDGYILGFLHGAEQRVMKQDSSSLFYKGTSCILEDSTLMN